MIKNALGENSCLSYVSLVQRHTPGGLFLLVVLASIGSLLYSTLSWMWDEQRLPLSKMVLKGDLDYVTARDVQLAFGQLENIGTFMSQDINILQNALSSIPWVSHVSIRKQWPDTIKIFLSEYNAVAIWNEDRFLNEKGDVFKADVGKLKGDRVKLYGPLNSHQEVLAVWNNVSPVFQELGLNIASLILNERRAWQIILDNGIYLKFGKRSLNERIERFSTLYKNLGSNAEQVDYIDLRYDTGAAVGWLRKQKLGQESAYE
ncbi:cell division protein [Candidatus Photodesmus blepharus]|uniref:Cell division protein FtsQ n=1 Tax=Candidatus Photodesmus blepharonis TaxID=1179155 RepID=A0A084CMV0_9GAMM|nr:cell division protein FtsQ/DivIB [Candidatus Photodesmus blepharus]KEY91129.1 cell division protein [Candidatus Photodesmus blepharus]